jgi:hypothetical protein
VGEAEALTADADAVPSDGDGDIGNVRVVDGECDKEPRDAVSDKDVERVVFSVAVVVGVWLALLVGSEGDRVTVVVYVGVGCDADDVGRESLRLRDSVADVVGLDDPVGRLRERVLLGLQLGVLAVREGLALGLPVGVGPVADGVGPVAVLVALAVAVGPVRVALVEIVAPVRVGLPERVAPLAVGVLREGDGERVPMEADRVADRVGLAEPLPEGVRLDADRDRVGDAAERVHVMDLEGVSGCVADAVFALLEPVAVAALGVALREGVPVPPVEDAVRPRDAVADAVGGAVADGVAMRLGDTVTVVLSVGVAVRGLQSTRTDVVPSHCAVVPVMKTYEQLRRSVVLGAHRTSWTKVSRDP